MLLRRHEVSSASLKAFDIEVPEDQNIFEPVEIALKYEGYISRQNELISQAKKLEDMKLPDTFDYSLVRGLSSEERDKLKLICPKTLGQASRISGVNPSAIQAILIYLKAGRGLKHAEANDARRPR